jgi:uncharacterized protein YjbJ (UPF0337 family)
VDDRCQTLSESHPLPYRFDPRSEIQRSAAHLQELTMDKDRIDGAARQVKGSIKEAVGKVTGDSKTEAEGVAEKAAGKLQNSVGGAKDAARDALRK